MELLQDLSNTEQESEKRHWKARKARRRSGKRSVKLETSVNDRSYGWRNDE